MTHFLFRNKSRRSAWLQGAAWRLEAASLALFWRLAGALPPERASAIGRRVFCWLGPRTGKQQRIRGNLRLAFPDLGNEQIDALARDIWGNFGSVLAEYPHLDRLANASAPGGIRMEIEEETRGILAQGKPAVFVTAHLGNWELAAAAIAGLGVPLSVVYAPQDNPHLDRMLQARRDRPGCRFIGKADALRPLLREIRAGRSVGLLPDQRLDSGEPLPFFGRNTPSPVTPAWLSRRTGCPLIPIQIVRTADARYRAIFHKPVALSSRRDEREDIVRVTATINRLFEDWIRQHPEQWLCMKRRWPRASCRVDPGATPGRRM